MLATSVGAIPDVIIDGKNGFIMENNSPECIVENVIRALNFPDLEQIAENGKRFVEENFSFEKKPWKTGGKFFKTLSSHVQSIKIRCTLLIKCSIMEKKECNF